MSNHSGGHMLNQVLELLDSEFSFFEGKTNKEVADILYKFTKIGCFYDCNDYEILEGIGAKYKVCSCCGLAVKEFDEDATEVCEHCYNGIDKEKYNAIVIPEDVPVELVKTKDTSRYWATYDYQFIYNNGEYTTRVYHNLLDAEIELKRYLNGELL